MVEARRCTSIQPKATSCSHVIWHYSSPYFKTQLSIGSARKTRDAPESVWCLLTHQDLLLYVLAMVTAALSTKKAVALFHALSDETRLALLDRLRNGEQCVCELTDAMKAAQSRLSFHLKVLKDAGLVEDRREGRWMYYSLSPKAIEELYELVSSFKKAARSAISAGRCC
jgi:ArsR family transcriptional regulator